MEKKKASKAATPAPAAAIRAPRQSRRGQSTRLALVDAAEQLIAGQGLARVSISQVARAADQKSRAATHYYFQSIEELVLAVLERRGPDIRARRAAMLAELELSGRAHDIRSIVEAVVLPVTSLLGNSGAHFRCVVQLNTAFGGDKKQWLHPLDLKQWGEWQARLSAELQHLPERLRALRIEMVEDLSMMALARFEAALEEYPDFDTAFASQSLIDAFTQILAAPAPVRPSSASKKAKPKKS